MKISSFIFSIVIILNIKSTLSFVDFFINSNETQTLLGYSGSLYYIYYGDLRYKTQSQVLNINSNKSTIQYSWKSYQRRVNYKIDLNEQLDLSLDTPLVGDVPTELSTFNLKVNCKSAKNYDFRVKISFNSKKSFEEINLNLNYLKICKDNNALKLSSTTTSSFEIKTDYKVAFTIIIIIVIAVILVLLFTILRQDFKLKNKKFNFRFYYKIFRGSKPLLTKVTPPPAVNIINNKLDDSSSYNLNANYSKLITNSSKLKQQLNRNSGECSNQNIYETLKDLTCVSANLNQTNITTITQNNNPDLVTSNTKPMSGLRAKKRESRFKVNTSQVKIGDLLLEGTFGRIYEGLLTKKIYDSEGGSDDATDETRECVVKVFIKTVSELASTKQADLMVSEASLLKYVKHKHVNSLLGLCFDSSSSPLVLFNYCENGNLKNYLKNQQKNEFKSSQLNLTIQELLYMTLQLCKAVNFIHLKRIVHKDIAARNCWIDKNLFIKLSDSALSRDIFPNDYHCLGDNENRPIMWLAFESICENKYSIESDIWSLGVTIWEILSLAKQPYEDIDPFDMETYLVHDRNRLQKPNKCPIELHQIYAKCWRLDAQMRPTLKDLFNSMLEFYSTLGNYV